MRIRNEDIEKQQGKNSESVYKNQKWKKWNRAKKEKKKEKEKEGGGKSRETIRSRKRADKSREKKTHNVSSIMVQAISADTAKQR